MSQQAKFGRSTHGANIEFVRTFTPYILRPHSIRTFPPVTKKKILPASVLNWTNFKPNRAHWLVGFPILMAFLPASVLNWTNFKPNRAHWLVGFPILMAFGCTFIHGGVHTRTHMYWERGIHYRGCTFIAGGVHTRTHVYWGRGINYRGCTFIAGGVHTRMHVYWGRGINYRRCTFIAGGVHTRTHILPQPVKSI